jgi:opacity protein-like surface antigen
LIIILNQQILIEYNTGWALGGAFGASLDSGLRLENELIYRQASPRTAGGDLWTLAWMINVWWDARNSSPFTPYFGGGFGLGRGHVASPGPIDNSGSGAVYQVGGGLDYKFDRHLSLDVGYRYFGIADTSSSGGVGSVDLAGSSVLAGLRWRF